jgi:hypothetical protein
MACNGGALVLAEDGDGGNGPGTPRSLSAFSKPAANVGISNFAGSAGETVSDFPADDFRRAILLKNSSRRYGRIFRGSSDF